MSVGSVHMQEVTATGGPHRGNRHIPLQIVRMVGEQRNCISSLIAG
jgi:hypothetical protein